MRKILFLTVFACLFGFISESLNAAPAKPGLIEFIQPNGGKLNIYLHGDEFLKWASSTDGYTLLFNNDGFYEYAILNQSGDLVPSGVVAKNIDERNATDLVLLASANKNLYFSNSQIQYAQQLRNIYESEAKNAKVFPTTGERKLLCILIGFTDKTITKTQAEFNNLFNQVNYSTGGATGSVKDYYLENSYGQFNLTVDIAGPYVASQNMTYYGGNDANGSDLRPRDLIQEAVLLANADVNYADYDNDNDGYVDGIYVIYAGYGEEAGGSANAIWAHQWSLYPSVQCDGKYINKYSCSAELRGTSGSNITRIGVICHEFGHVLGAPDYYDTDYDEDGQYDGTGNWDLMAGGSWNNNGATPAHHNAYTKVYIYNWASAITLSTQQKVVMLNSVQNSTSFYRYNTTTNNEYFLLENRQKIGFDASIPGHGMLIYHVDESYISSHTNYNNINCTSHQGMFPIAANATSANGVMAGSGAVSTSACPWPGTNNKTSFTDATTPNSKSWAGANTNKPLTNITETGNIVQFCFINCPAECTPPTTQASNFSTSDIDDNQIRVNWTRGNGNGVIVVAKKSSPVDANPINAVNYTANANFGLGQEIGEDNFVVYKGTGTNVLVNDLSPVTNYYFAVYEYFSANNCYKIPGLIGNASTTGQVANFCDSINQFCCTPSLYTTGEDNSYVSGTNEYNFSAFAEKFADPSPFNQLEGFRVYFGVIENTTNPNITFVAWDNANGVPTNELATKTVPLASVKTAMNAQGFYDVYFDDMVSIPSNGFYVGLLEPGASGNIIAIITNQQGEGENTGYTKYGSWYDYESLFGGSFQHLILPFICYNNALPPIADFLGTPTRVALGETVQFSDLTSGSVPNSWTWTFEGGTPPTSGIANPNITYNTIGFYDVSLTVSNDNGSNSISKPNYIEVYDPNNVSAFSLDFEACADFQVDNFAPWTTLDVDGSATYGTGSFSFPNSGYTGSFIAFNSNNTNPAATGWEAHGGNLCGICFAANTPPNNDWLISSQIQLGDNSSFSFWAKSITNQYGLERFVVHVSTTGNQPANFTKISTGTYIQAATTWTKYEYDLSAYNNQTVYIAVQCVSNDAFAFMIDDIEIYSEYSAPTCDFSADQTVVEVGSTVNFTDESTQMPTSWQWSFPGGTPSTSTAQNPSIVYNDLGTYDVSLTVTNNEGSDTNLKTGYITVTEPPEVIVLWDFPNNPDNNIADAGITANLTKTITPFGGVNDILYTATGVTTRCIDGETWASGANSKGWSVNFTTTEYEGLKLSFAQMSNNAQSPRDFKVQYSLNGSTWTDLGVSYQLATNVWTEKNEISLPAACNNQANVYIRWLMTSNTSCNGGTVSSNQTTRRNAMDNVKVTGLLMSEPPEADFIASSTTICEGGTINFTDLTSNTPNNWLWTFEGGTPATSNLQSPNITYNATGTYQVSLTASNASGSDTKTKTAYITVHPNPSISASNSGPYCVGETITLNATGSGGTNYTWTGPAEFNSNAQNPTIINAQINHSGIYTVSLSNTSTGCSATATTEVIINANPSLSVSNNGPICEGETIEFTANGSGGTIYSWSGPAGFTSNLQNPVRANAILTYTGDYTVSLSNTSTGCSTSITNTVLINANPTISASNNETVCEGGNITLNASGTGGSSYEWTGPNNYFSNNQNPTINNIQSTQSGEYIVVLTNLTTGCNASASTNIIVNENPTITASSNEPVCQDETIQLYASGNADLYSWTGPNGFTSSNQNPEIQNANNSHIGVYSVTATNSATTCFASASTNVYINSNPLINLGEDIEVCSYETIILDAGNHTSYEWNGETGNSTYIVELPGTYTVVVSNNNGCTASDQITISHFETLNINISTNPESSMGANDGSASVVINSGTAPYTYLWTGGATTETINGLTNGIYCVTIIDANGCVANECGEVYTEGLPPIANFTSDVNEGCAPLTVNFTNASTNNPLTWLWNFGDENTANTQNSSNTFENPGTYQVSLTVENLDGSNTHTITISVHENPTPSLGNDIEACEGETVNLNPGNYQAYLWSNGETSQTIAVTQNGEYFVTITDNNGCSGSTSVNVEFNPIPEINIGGDQAICDYESVTLNAGNYFSNYEWNTGSVDQTIVTNEAGTYSVTVTNEFGCTGSDSMDLTVNPAPTTNLPETINACTNELFSFTLEGDFDEILWSDGSTDATFENTWTQDGEYEVSVTVVLNNCETTNSMLVTVAPCTGINDILSNMNVDLFPNPSSKECNLVIKDYSGEITTSLSDIQGKKLWQIIEYADGEYVQTIDLSNLAPGMYFLQLQTSEGSTNFKIIRDK